MNQILFSKYNNLKETPMSSNEPQFVPTSRKQKLFVMLLSISATVFVAIGSYLLYSAYSETKREELYRSLANDYSIARLYANNTTESDKSIAEPIFNIIGIVKIDKIKISYPILSTINDDLLKIGPCRFAGPDIANTTGNLCIAAHNYDDSRFFSNISKLNINDEIQVFDANGNVMLYQIFDKYDTATSDTSCTLPLGNNTIEITLITCNNFTGNRIIVKAKSIMT